MRILAIDPGTHAGWTVRHSSVAWDSGSWDLSAKRHEGGGMRFLRARTYLRELIDAAQPDVVVYEEVRQHLGVDAAHIYGGLVAIIATECEARTPPVPYKGIPVGTAKKLATGKGNAKKAAMVAAAALRWPGYAFSSEDEVDARWIAEAAAQELGG